MAIRTEPLEEFLANDEFVMSLHALSASKRRLPDGSFKTCLSSSSPVGGFKALNLDEVKAAHCRMGDYPLGGMSADALMIHGDELYLIEFKTSDLKAEEWFRKVYDSVIFLVELGVVTWQDCREHLTFVTVQTEADRRFSYYDLGRRTGKTYGSTWEYELADIKDYDLDARVLTGQIARKIYRLTPEDFESFVAQRNWVPQSSANTWVSVMLGGYDVSAGPTRNAVYPTEWSQPVYFPMGRPVDDVSYERFLRFRAERFIKQNSSTEDVHFERTELVSYGSGKALYGVCDNPLAAGEKWHVGVWMQDVTN